ncbi:MAG: ADP-ribosylglycohydrolase family protein [Ignavibacteriales bacterium]
MRKGQLMMDKNQLFEHAYGCLLGVACGDAMGMPTSLWSPEQIKAVFPKRITGFHPAPKGHIIHNGMAAGQITDDTQQTLLLADLILEEGRFSKEGVARKLLEWAESLKAFESLLLGPSSLRALKLIKDGVPLDKTGFLGDTNGAAMRISPVGIMHPGDYDGVIEDVVEVCIPTHNTNIAIAGASGVACVISAGMTNCSVDTLIEAFHYGVNKGMQRGNPYYSASIIHRTEWALELIKSGKPEEAIWQDLYNYIGAGVAMSECIPTALALVVYYEGDPIRTIEAAVNMGGDCDTVAAIAGSMAGAYSGINAFPEEIGEKIEEVNSIDLKKYAWGLTNAIVSAYQDQVEARVE